MRFDHCDLYCFFNSSLISCQYFGAKWPCPLPILIALEESTPIVILVWLVFDTTTTQLQLGFDSFATWAWHLCNLNVIQNYDMFDSFITWVQHLCNLGVKLLLLNCHVCRASNCRIMLQLICDQQSQLYNFTTIPL